MNTITEFVNEHKIKAEPQYTDRNPNMDDEGRNMDNWRVTLKRGRRRFTVYFSKGFGHNGHEPSAMEVLDCLASDACSTDNASSFEDWCRDIGYDTDSRRAHRTFKIIEAQAAKLKRFLGDDLYEALLYNTERE